MNNGADREEDILFYFLVFSWELLTLQDSPVQPHHRPQGQKIQGSQKPSSHDRTGSSTLVLQELHRGNKRTWEIHPQEATSFPFQLVGLLFKNLVALGWTHSHVLFYFSFMTQKNLELTSQLPHWANAHASLQSSPFTCNVGRKPAARFFSSKTFGDVFRSYQDLKRN